MAAHNGAAGGASIGVHAPVSWNAASRWARAPVAHIFDCTRSACGIGSVEFWLQT